MTTKNCKHILGDGTEKELVRLLADDGKELTKDGLNFWKCIDVPAEDVGLYAEVDETSPLDDGEAEAEAEDYEKQMARFGV